RLHDADAIFGRQARDELDRLLHVGDLAAKAAVASQEARRIDTVRKQRLHSIDFSLRLQGGDPLRTIGEADALDRIILKAEAVEQIAQGLDADRHEVRYNPLGGQPQRTEVLK